jgi:hypothetical protein
LCGRLGRVKIGCSVHFVSFGGPIAAHLATRTAAPAMEVLSGRRCFSRSHYFSGRNPFAILVVGGIEPPLKATSTPGFFAALAAGAAKGCGDSRDHRSAPRDSGRRPCHGSFIRKMSPFAELLSLLTPLCFIELPKNRTPTISMAYGMRPGPFPNP